MGKIVVVILLLGIAFMVSFMVYFSYRLGKERHYYRQCGGRKNA